MATIVGLLRHGQTDWNIDMRLQGVSDIPLNSHGRFQAISAAPVIQAQGWQHIVSSPLGRALETAKLVTSDEFHSQIKIEPLLIERSFGDAEGETYESWKDRLQAGHHANGAESIEALENRVVLLLEALRQDFPNSRVLTVSHGALIRKIINHVSLGELPREGERFGNTSLTTIIYDDSGWSILDYNPATIAN